MLILLKTDNPKFNFSPLQYGTILAPKQKSKLILLNIYGSRIFRRRTFRRGTVRHKKKKTKLKLTFLLMAKFPTVKCPTAKILA